MVFNGGISKIFYAKHPIQGADQSYHILVGFVLPVRLEKAEASSFSAMQVGTIAHKKHAIRYSVAAYAMCKRKCNTVLGRAGLH